MRTKRTCVHCGCTDDKACKGGCCWIVQHRATATGVCSQCDKQVLVELVRGIVRADTPVMLMAKGRAHGRKH